MSALAVFAPRRFARLLAGDAMNVGRDPMLLLAIVMSLAPAIVLNLVGPAMDAAAAAAFGVARLSHVVAPLALLIPAVLIGWVTGFLLLEDRDEGTLLALDVTPPGKSGFLAYRVAVTAIVTLAVTGFAWPLIEPGESIWLGALVAAEIAATAIASAVILPAIARNKVEGLALTKLTNIAAVAPLLALVPSPLRYVAGIIPTYWIGELLGLASQPALPFWALALISAGVHALAVAGLFALLRRRAG